MIFVDIFILLVIFVVSSFGSGYIMHKNGYGVPKKLTSREDYLLILMKLTLFSLLAVLLLVIVMLAGLDPLKMMD